MSAILLYDGDCAFCSTSVRWLRRWAPNDARVEPWQSMDLAALGIERSRVEREVVWLGPEGTAGGAAGVARYLRAANRGWRMVGLLISVPPISWLAAGVYRVIANNRHRLPGGTPTCSLRDR